MNAETWLGLFEPYQAKYSIKIKIHDCLFNDNEIWITKQERLDYKLIYQALLGKKKIGFYNTYQTRVIGIDIDSHYSVAFFKNNQPSKELLNKYENVIKKIGFYPNVLFRSDNGFHLFYLFEYKAPHELFDLEFRKKLKGLGSVEILPSPEHSLRIDPIKRHIDPITLQETEFEVEKISRYYPYEIFNADLIPSKFRTKTGKERVDRARAFYQSEAFEELENSLLPIKAGHSNAVYCQIIPVYYRAGLDEFEAKQRFLHLLFRSRFHGKLDNDELVRKIRSSYRNFKKNGYVYTGNPSEHGELLLVDLEFIENLSQKNPFSRQRLKPLKKYLENLCRWLNYHDYISKREFEFWSWYYKEYRLNRKMHLYPIPKVIMETWNSRYYEIMDWLQSIGIASIETGYYFDLAREEKGSCRYWRIKRLYEAEKTNLETEFIMELKNSGKTQTEIAKILGVSQKQISCWFSGKQNIPMFRLQYYQDKFELYQKCSNNNTAPVFTDTCFDFLNELKKLKS